MSGPTDLIESGLRAWLGGDLDTLEQLLDPDVTLEWTEAGGMDCVGRRQVMDTLQRGRANATQRPPRLERLSDDVVLVFLPVNDSDNQPIITRVSFKNSKIVRMQQFSSRDSAARGSDPVEDAAVATVHAGDIQALHRLLADHPSLAAARLGDHGDRTLLHAATDWPGHFPNVGGIVAALVAAGADVDAPSIGDHTETPLHWAASSDDVDALDALLDAGANIEARGAVIGGGTPLSDATAFGCWNTARRLVERGAHPQMWEAAALGLLPQLQPYLDNDPTPEAITHSFWSACHGNQLDAAKLLLDRGADINWIGYDDLTPLDAARRSEGTAIIDWLKARGAGSASTPPETAPPTTAQ